MSLWGALISSQAFGASGEGITSGTCDIVKENGISTISDNLHNAPIDGNNRGMFVANFPTDWQFVDSDYGVVISKTKKPEVNIQEIFKNSEYKFRHGKNDSTEGQWDKENWEEPFFKAIDNDDPTIFYRLHDLEYSVSLQVLMKSFYSSKEKCLQWFVENVDIFNPNLKGSIKIVRMLLRKEDNQILRKLEKKLLWQSLGNPVNAEKLLSNNAN